MAISKDAIQEYIENLDPLAKDTFVQGLSGEKRKNASKDLAKGYIQSVAKNLDLSIAERIKGNARSILENFSFEEFELSLKVILDEEFSKPDPFHFQVIKPLLFFGTKILTGVSFGGRSDLEQKGMLEALVWAGVFVTLEEE